MTDTSAADPGGPSAPGSDEIGRSARGEAASWFARGAGAAAGALFVVAIAAAAVIAWRVVILVFLAVLFGSALEPLVGRLRGRLPIPRGVAILIVYVAFFALVALAMLVVVPGSLNQASSLAVAAPDALDRFRSFAAGLRPQGLADSVQALVDAAGSALEPGPPPQAGEVVEAGLTIADAAVWVITILALVYFWMTERARLQRFALSFLPADRRGGARNAWNDIELRLGGWVRAQLVLMAAIGSMTGVACWVLGLPSPLLLGLLAGLAELIPMVGPAIGAIPALLVAAALRPEVLPLVIVAYVVIHLIEGNVLVPLVMRNVVGISPFVVIASLLVGGALDGFRGALIAVPVAAAIEVILERLQDRELPVSPTSEGAAATESEADVTDPQAPAPSV